MGQTSQKENRSNMHFIQLEGRTFVEEGVYIARCDSLDISDHGISEKEAVDNLGKTIGLFFLSCIKRGTFKQFLKDRGLQPVEIDDDGAQNEKIFVPVVVLSNSDASSSGDKRRMPG